MNHHTVSTRTLHHEDMRALTMSRPFGPEPAETPPRAADHEFARVSIRPPTSAVGWPIQRVDSDDSNSDEEREEPSASGKSEREESEQEASDEDAPPRKRVRVRPPHDLSEGESESEDPNVLYRSLRADEDPLNAGLLPPEGHNPDKTASEHVTAGTRAMEKSPWVSFSRSAKVTGAWASKKKGGRVARVQLTPDLRRGRETVDFTDEDQAKTVFPKLKGSSYNTALSSQEVLVKQGVPREGVQAVYNARKVTKKEYDALEEGKGAVVKKARSRAEVRQKGKPLNPHYFVFEDPALLPPPEPRGGTQTQGRKKRKRSSR